MTLTVCWGAQTVKKLTISDTTIRGYGVAEVPNSGVVLEGHIVVLDRDLPLVLKELPNHIKLTREEKGCLVFSVSQRSSEPNVFNVFEEFTDRRAFDEHQKRVRHSVWGEATANVERHYKVRGIA